MHSGKKKALIPKKDEGQETEVPPQTDGKKIFQIFFPTSHKKTGFVQAV